MFSHRGLFLAVTISLASIALTGVLAQPAHEHQYDSNPRHLQHQSVSQQQLPDQESTRYLQGVETKKNEDPKETRRKRMEEYSRKMDFIRHMDGGRSLQPLMVPNRRKRSDPAKISNPELEYFLSSVIDRFLIAINLPSNITDAMRHSYEYLIARVGNITVFQAIVNILLNYMYFYTVGSFY